ncbi:hypothetical protein A6302_03845 [Methylobrevis pamukkalensis]|uniref:Uncharacterized protein n=2 Tax=Methylobrevis pamukkalensis TaxID=1439726 RepID=A0A1E3GXR1_9HYPH|nr:hypothetical protein A6302_03845 [Methylobrevis pamukkalensis]
MTALQVARLRHEQELFNAARSAGIALSPQQQAELGALAGKMAEVEIAAQSAATSQQAFDDAMSSLEDYGVGVVQSLVDGTFEWRDALRALVPVIINVIGKLAEAGSFQGMSIGGGGGGGLLGGLFSAVGSLFGGMFGGGGGVPLPPVRPTFARGGIMTPNGPAILPRYASGGVARSAAIFGEAGPEAAVPLPDGRSIPVSFRLPSKPAGARPNGMVVNNITGGSLTIEGNVTDDTMPKLQAELDRREAALKREIQRNFGAMQAGYNMNRRM